MPDSDKIVRIYGMAPNMGNASPPPAGVEVWCSNDKRGYQQRYPPALQEWTRWFNMHSRRHQQETYLDCYRWYQSLPTDKPIYMQRVNPDIPASVEFPCLEIQEYFKTSSKPQRYFSFTGAWLMALAIYLGFERIEMWGFEIKSTKPAYAWERPCFFYWVDEARRRGIDVWLPPELIITDAGDPNTYTGPLYGYETKPELEL